MDIELQKAFSEAERRIGFVLPAGVEFIPRDENGFSVRKEGEKITVGYSDKHFAFQAAAYLRAMKNDSTEVCGPFRRFGVMVDCARNGVPKPEQFKDFIVRLAFSGYSYVGLYLEDCFEVDEEPYFGYMRGRYTKKELSDLVAFAQMFGIEIVPYIQTLAHISGIFHHWEQYTATVKDFGDTLLIGEPRTYELIDHMLQTVSEVFTSKKINLGMDEAFMMLLGKYRQLHGIQNRAALFSQHIEKVCSLCKKYGLQPSVWADMFERYADDPNLNLPPDLELTVWSYYLESESEYRKMIESVEKITKKISFAGGIHKWYGYVPLNEYSQRTLLPSLRAAVGKTDDFCITLWGDDGAECSYNAVWYSLLRASNCTYTGAEIDEDALSEAVTGYSMEELLAMDLPNRVFEGEVDHVVNVSKYTLFEDVFYGISDRRSSELFAKYFHVHAKRLHTLAQKEGAFSYLFEEYAALCDVLELKTGLRQKIRRSYGERDRKAIRGDAELVAQIRFKTEKLNECIQRQWLIDHKPFGIEVQQIRLGGLIERLKYVERCLQEYADGKTDRIDELEETDLSPVLTGDCRVDAKCYTSYEQNVTYGMISHKLFN